MVKMGYRLSSDRYRTMTVKRNLRVIANYDGNEGKKGQPENERAEGQMENGVGYSQHDT
jgi:hypothetical protein